MNSIFKWILAAIRYVLSLLARLLSRSLEIDTLLWAVQYFRQKGTGRPFSWYLFFADIFQSVAGMSACLAVFLILATLVGYLEGGRYTLIVLFGVAVFGLPSFLLWLLFRALARRSGISLEDMKARDKCAQNKRE